jgi:hypothetical protein
MEEEMEAARSIDFHALVNQVANEFESATGMPVNPNARGLLISLAVPHRLDVQRELDSGGITIEFLEQGLRTLLENARDIALERGVDRIGEDITDASMQRYCPYLFWC